MSALREDENVFLCSVDCTPVLCLGFSLSPAETPYLIKKFLAGKGLDIVDVALADVDGHGGSGNVSLSGEGSPDSPASSRGDDTPAGSPLGSDERYSVRSGPVAGATTRGSPAARYGRRAMPTAFAGA